MTGKKKMRLLQTNLKYLLSRAAGGVGKMTPYFLIDVYLTRITCTAVDSGLRIVSEISLHDGEMIECGGTVCVSAAKLIAAIDALPATFLDISIDGEKLLVECGDYSGVVPGVDPAAYFPSVPWPSRKEDFYCAGDLFQRLHTACHHSLSKDQKNPKLTGLYIRCDDNKLIACATDGHRMSVAAIGDQPEGCEIFASGLIIPPKGLTELKKLQAGWLQIWKEENTLNVSAPGISLAIQLYTDDYPDFRRVVPADNDSTCVVTATDLVKIVERVNILSESDAITLDIKSGDSDGGDIRAYAQNAAGEVSDLVCAEVSGADLEIIINPQYLIDSLNSIARDSADVLIKYGDDGRALVLIPCDHAGWDERLEIVMPRRK